VTFNIPTEILFLLIGCILLASVGIAVVSFMKYSELLRIRITTENYKPLFDVLETKDQMYRAHFKFCEIPTLLITKNGKIVSCNYSFDGNLLLSEYTVNKDILHFIPKFSKLKKQISASKPLVTKTQIINIPNHHEERLHITLLRCYKPNGIVQEGYAVRFITGKTNAFI